MNHQFCKARKMKLLLENDFFVATDLSFLLLVTFLWIKDVNLNKVTKERGFCAQCLESLRTYEKKNLCSYTYSAAVKIYTIWQKKYQR